MAKITIDIESIKQSLSDIGYEISDFIERENNGINWQLKFSNSGAIVTIYDTNTKKNSVVNGKCDEEEKNNLKVIVDGLKCKEIQIDPLNHIIVQRINEQREDYDIDFKREWYSREKKADMLHDVLCLSNNIENKDAYLVIGVDDEYQVVGVNNPIKSNDIIDYFKSKRFAGDHIPVFELKKLYYKFKTIYVIVCKSSKYVPFYLTEREQKVCDHRIYTRVGDTNTPVDKSASYSDVERLWRIHFERENE